MKVFWAQCVGSAVVCTATLLAAMAMFWALNKVNLLRVSRAGEVQGLGPRPARRSRLTPSMSSRELAAPAGMASDTINGFAQAEAARPKPFK